MSYSLILSPEAEQDILAILAYSHENWGEGYARTYLSKLEHGLELLQKNPHIGRARDDISNFHRSFLIGQHTAVYFISDDMIYLSRIFHQSRDISGQDIP